MSKEKQIDQKPQYSSHAYLIKRLVRENILQHKSKFAVAVLLMIIVAATTSLHAWLVKPAVDIMFEEKDETLLIIIPLAIFGITLLRAAATYFQTLIMSLLSIRMTCDMRLRLYEHFIYSDISMFNERSSGKLISNITNDINLVMTAVDSFLTGLIRQLLTVIFLVGLMFYINYELAFISFIAFPLAALPIYLIGKRTTQAYNA